MIRKYNLYVSKRSKIYNYQKTMDSRKNIVVTGGNTGIGLQTARGLFGDGHNIIFGSRGQQKNEAAAKSIRQSFPNSKGSVKWLKLDLSKRASIESFSEQVKKQFDHIDILVNNAGVIIDDRQISELGVEMTMTVNHFGPFYLTYLLFPNIKKSKEARIINVSSLAHQYFKSSTSQDLTLDNGYGSTDAYSKSKLANVQFTFALAQRISKYPSIKTMSLHPGAVDSDFLSKAKCCSLWKILKFCCCCCFVDTQTGARTSLYLAREPFASLRNGEYYDSDTSLGAVNQLGNNKEHIEKLWKVSQQLFKIQFNP